MEDSKKFTIITYKNDGLYFESTLPSFSVLMFLIDMENKGYFINGDFLNIDDDVSLLDHEKIIADIIKTHNITKLSSLIDYLLRGFTFNNIRNIITQSISSEKDVVIKKGLGAQKILVPKELKNFAKENILDNGFLLYFLYNANCLKKAVAKQDLKMAKNNSLNFIIEDCKPLCKYILENLPTIRGYITALVCN